MQSFEYVSREICLPDGLYNFTIWDEYGEIILRFALVDADL